MVLHTLATDVVLGHSVAVPSYDPVVHQAQAASVQSIEKVKLDYFYGGMKFIQKPMLSFVNQCNPITISVIVNIIESHECLKHNRMICFQLLEKRLNIKVNSRHAWCIQINMRAKLIESAKQVDRQSSLCQLS